MSRFDKFQVMAKIAAAPMVPVFYNKDVEVCKNVIKACYEGGVRAFEFTNRGDFAHEVFGELSKWVAKECPELALGIGSLDPLDFTACFLEGGKHGLGFHGRSVVDDMVTLCSFCRMLAVSLCDCHKGECFGFAFVAEEIGLRERSCKSAHFRDCNFVAHDLFSVKVLMSHALQTN